MRLSKENREELVAELVATYELELEALTDAELLSHWQAQHTMQDMTDEEWAGIARQSGG